MHVLEVNDVHKRLGKRNIINGISLTIGAGEIFGFLGPNGAGKTTTIRMLVGLIAPNKGEIKIMGHDISKEREKALNAVGSVVENPELYTFLTGRQNLVQLSRMYKGIGKKEIDEVIRLVGLENRIDEKVRRYSLGMKQRLGLAEALLSKPKLLILDEPTNGLDPSGIIEFRNIVKRMAREYNMAVFVSSHMLPEVQQLCDKVAFIDNGQIKSIESLDESAVDNTLHRVMIVTSETKKCLRLIETIPYIKDINIVNEGINIYIQRDSNSALIKTLVENNIPIEEFYIKHQALEDRYMELVEGGNIK